MRATASIQPPTTTDRAERVRPPRPAPTQIPRPKFTASPERPDSISVSRDARRASAVAAANQTAAKPNAVQLGPDALGTTDPSVKPQPIDVASLIKSFGQKSGEDGFNLAFDLNADGIIDSKDLNEALAKAEPAEPTQVEQIQTAFGAARGDDAFDSALDLNKDGVIDSTDLNQALADA